MNDELQQDPAAEELAEQEETIARRCAMLLEVAREALELDRWLTQRRRKNSETPTC